MPEVSRSLDDLTDEWNGPFLGCWLVPTFTENDLDVFHISESKFVVGMVV